ncbi:hypothetical protein Tco_0154811 [Tanacetum coccineum]
MMDVAFDFVGKDDDGLGYGLDRSTNLWVHGRDILRDIFGHNLLHEVHTSACHLQVDLWKIRNQKIDFCNEIFEFFHQHGVIGIDVASTGELSLAARGGMQSYRGGGKPWRPSGDLRRQ